jgi:hypothetical protein
MRATDFIFNQPAAGWTAKLTELDVILYESLWVAD